MTGKSVANVHNGLSSAGPPDTMSSVSNRRRSNLVAASARSSKSRVTLVENDPDLTANNESISDNTYEVVTCHPPKYTFVDRLLAVFCVNGSKRKQPITRKEYMQPKTPEGSEIGNSPSTWPSPWILPVYVLSNRQDTDRHPITKIAKCTIDTGNMQGNIVSREFVEKVLDFPASSFRKLTKEEERGGTGITGDSHIPQGAIYLTWYHKNSTRVFRDMRFLISPTQHCDLIIGARSIQKENILNVPCLMSGNQADIIIVDPVKIDDLERQRLVKIHHKKTGDLDQAKIRVKEIEREDCDYDDELPALRQSIPQLNDEVNILDWTIQIYDITYQTGKNHEERRMLADPLWEKLRVTFHSDEMKKQLDQLWEKLRTELGYEEKFIVSTALTYSSGIEPLSLP